MVLASILFLGLLHESSLGKELRYRTETVSFFNLRDKFSYAPELASQMQLFLNDDPTVAHRLQFDLVGSDWRKIFKAISERTPAAIIVVQDQAELDLLADDKDMPPLLSTIDTPVFFVTPIAPLTPYSQFTTKGPFSELWPGQLEAQWQKYRGKNLKPHYPENSRIGLIPRAELISRSFNMVALISRAHSGASIDPVQPGDYVLLNSKMYTGATRWLDTPLGHMQEGFVVAGAINGFLSDHWLVNSQWNLINLFIASCAGYLLAYWMSGLWLGLSYLLSLGLLSYIGFLCFAQLGVITGVIFPAAGLSAASLIVFSERFRLSFLEKKRLSQELKTSSFVQESFLSTPRAECHFLELHTYLEPASECSGDWWSGFSLDQNRYMLIVTDAVGHGTPAALMTAIAHAGCHTLEHLLMSKSLKDITPSSLLNFLNDIFYQSMHGRYHITASALLFDYTNQQLTLASAGHAPPYLLSSSETSNKAKPLVVRGAPLAIEHQPHYLEKSYKLSYGDRVILYTDGIYEAPNHRGEQFGKRRLRSVIEEHHGLLAPNLAKELVSRISQHCGKVAPTDDMTIIVSAFNEK